MATRRLDIRSLTRPISRPVAVDHGPAGDLFADSVNGSDLNDGRHYTRPTRTLAALGAIAPFTRVGIANGSRFREELRSAETGVEVFAYGDPGLPRPILDATDVLSGFADVGDGSWSKAVSLPATGNGWARVYEDGAPLARAANQAACAATAGTYLPSAESGEITLYIHPSIGDPNVNGRLYEATVRDHGLHLSGAQVRIKGIHARGAYHNDGCIVVSGPNASLQNVRAQDGGKHNMLISDGAVLEDNCVIDDCYFNGFGGMLVLFRDAATGLGASIGDVRITNSHAQPTPGLRSAIESHANSGSLGAVTIRGVTIDGTGEASGYGFGGGISMPDTASVDIIGLDARGVEEGVRTNSDTTVDGTSRIRSKRQGLLSGANDHSITFRGKVCVEAPNFFTPALHVTHAGVDLTADGAVLSDDGGGDFLGIGIQHTGTGSVSISDTTFGAGGFAVQAWIVTSTILAAMNSDNNHFEGAAAHQFKDATTPATYTLADVPNGLEANSDTDGDASAACA